MNYEIDMEIEFFVGSESLLLLFVIFSVFSLLMLFVFMNTKSSDQILNERLILTRKDLEKEKQESIKNILIMGPLKSGKSSVINRMVELFLKGEEIVEWRAITTPKKFRSSDFSVTEIEIQNNEIYQLRFWESDKWEKVLKIQPSHYFDGILLIVDPTQLLQLENTFPKREIFTVDALIDGNEYLLDIVNPPDGKLDSTISKWVILSKFDLLRFSIHPPLVQRIHLGESWYKQLQDLSLQDRKEIIVNCLDLKQMDHIELGAGSPWFTYTASGTKFTSFGERPLLQRLLTSIMSK